MKKTDCDSKERIEKYLFEDNCLEPPIFHNNKGKTLRFDLESKSETKNAELVENIFSDLFFESSKMFVVFYGDLWSKWRTGKRYFKMFSLKRILLKSYTSRNEDYTEDKPYLAVCLTDRSKFKLKKYLSDYLEDEQACQMAFISLKKGSTIQLYDSRGFDLLSADKDFLRRLYVKYEENIIEYNREEIKEALR